MRIPNEFGFGELNSFPGCNQLVVSGHAFIKPEFRGKGKGKDAHFQRLKEAVKLGYDAIICTVVANNSRQIAILKKFGWQQVFDFDNRETGNRVLVFMRHL